MKAHPQIQLTIPLPVTVTLLFCAVPFVYAVSPPPDGGYPGNNTAEGTNALLSLSTGVNNTALGFTALTHDTSGANNTAAGAFALATNTTGAANTATGVQALYKNATGLRNTADGAGALLHNNGSYNSATGWAALVNTTTGTANTADGAQALYFNTTGAQNTAEGAGALLHNTANGNTAVGWAALFNNTAGLENTAIGSQALFSNTTGADSTALGYAALFRATTGPNTALGYAALVNNTSGFDNVAVGSLAGENVTTGNANVILGSVAGFNVATANHVIAIGTGGGNVSNSCYIGNIYNQPVDADTANSVIVDYTGKLGTPSSSRRVKRDIKPMDAASEAILALKPVSFHYKSDAKRTPCFGLIAEEVAQVDPNLVVYDKNGEPLTVRYDAVNAMLLNEFLKEHRKGEERDRHIRDQESTIADLRSRIAQQQKVMATLAARLDQHDAQFQKVNAVELSESNRQIASRNHLTDELNNH